MVKVFDLHCDTVDRLCAAASGEAAFDERDKKIARSRLSDLGDNDADISLERMEGSQWCQCFGIFMPDELRGDAAIRFFDRNYDYFCRQVDRHGDAVVQVRTAADIQVAFESGRQAALLTVEGGSVLAGDERRVDVLVERGVRILTLTWNGPNEIASGNETHHGFTGWGRGVVGMLEQAGIIADVSHLNDTGFWELEGFATRPFIATHSNLRVVCDHPRNLTDDQFRVIAERGGIVGINFAADFLAEGGYKVKPDHLLRHVDRMLNMDGEHVVALGSDYDGADIPDWLRPCSRMRELHELLGSEFGGGLADAICFGNAYDFLARYDA